MFICQLKKKMGHKNQDLLRESSSTLQCLKCWGLNPFKLGYNPHHENWLNQYASSSHNSALWYTALAVFHGSKVKKVKGTAPMERRWGAHLPHIGLWACRWIDHWVCDASPVRPKPTVTFPAAEHHHPLAGTKLYCLVTEAHGCQQLTQSCYPAMYRPGVEPVTSQSQVQLHHRATKWP